MRRDGGTYTNATSNHADAGNRVAEPSLGVDWQKEPRSHRAADVKLLRDLHYHAGIRVCARARIIGAALVALAVLAREDPLAGQGALCNLCSTIFQAQHEILHVGIPNLTSISPLFRHRMVALQGRRSRKLSTNHDRRSSCSHLHTCHTTE